MAALSSGRGSIIRRIVKLEATPEGGYRPVEIPVPGVAVTSDRKKVPKEQRPIEKALRRVARAHERFAAVYLQEHQHSGAKKKNGAIRDRWKNLAKAARKGSKAR